MNSEKQLQSYVFNKDRAFFVSTIERDSSAAISPPPRYMETIAWEWDEEKKERGKILHQAGEGGATSQHFNMCKALYDFGEYRGDIDQ